MAEEVVQVSFRIPESVKRKYHAKLVLKGTNIQDDLEKYVRRVVG